MKRLKWCLYEINGNAGSGNQKNETNPRKHPALHPHSYELSLFVEIIVTENKENFRIGLLAPAALVRRSKFDPTQMATNTIQWISIKFGLAAQSIETPFKFNCDAPSHLTQFAFYIFRKADSRLKDLSQRETQILLIPFRYIMSHVLFI